MRANGSLRKGQSMWVLTKMAMIFFIGALAIILVLFGGVVKGGLCQASAQSTNARIANAINQVINSPLEDERRVVPLEPSLAVGESKSSRYSMTIAKRAPDPAAQAAYMIISTFSEANKDCSSGLQVSYPRSYEFDAGGALRERLFLISDRTESINPPDAFTKRIRVEPSLPPEKEKTAPPNFRSKFLVVMSCTAKDVSREKYFFIFDCVHDNSDSCLNFKSAISVGGAEVKSVCSFV